MYKRQGAGKYMCGFKTVTAMVDAMVDELGITVPVALHLDHGSYEGALKCIEAGFSSVMFDGSHYGLSLIHISLVFHFALKNAGMKAHIAPATMLVIIITGKRR